MWRYHHHWMRTRCFSSSSRALRWWDHVGQPPKDAIMSVTEAFLADPRPTKINLGVGAHRDDEGKPVILQCIRDAEAKIAGCDFFAHNATGVDPTEEQWREISYQFKVQNHFPFVDMAYQGCACGDFERDAQSIRIFLEDGQLIGCAQCFAKNMGLYRHRVGCLSILCNDTKQAIAIKSQLQTIARAMYGSPLIHGILLVSTILSDPDVKQLWFKEVKCMAYHIHQMRTNLRESLEQLSSSLNWEHITNQVGMFCFSGLTPKQVDRLVREFHVYMTLDGHTSMAGVTTGNVNYLANAIHAVTKH